MSMLRRLAAGVVLAGLVGTAVVVAARPSPSSSTPAARAERLASELRCPVCQGLSVADSPSITANDIRADIRRRIAAGESDAEIRQGYVDRYGDWILLRPRGRGFTALLWALPVAAVVVAVAWLALALRRWRRQAPLEATDEDEHLVAELRAARSARAAR